MLKKFEKINFYFFENEARLMHVGNFKCCKSIDAIVNDRVDRFCIENCMFYCKNLKKSSREISTFSAVFGSPWHFTGWNRKQTYSGEKTERSTARGRPFGTQIWAKSRNLGPNLGPGRWGRLGPGAAKPQVSFCFLFLLPEASLGTFFGTLSGAALRASMLKGPQSSAQWEAKQVLILGKATTKQVLFLKAKQQQLSVSIQVFCFFQGKQQQLSWVISQAWGISAEIPRKAHK